MQVEWSQSEEVVLVPYYHLGIVGPVGQIRHFHLQIHDPLEKWVQEQVEPSKSEQVTFFNFQTADVLKVFCVLWPN